MHNLREDIVDEFEAAQCYYGHVPLEIRLQFYVSGILIARAEAAAERELRQTRAQKQKRREGKRASAKRNRKSVSKMTKEQRIARATQAAFARWRTHD